MKTTPRSRATRAPSPRSSFRRSPPDTSSRALVTRLLPFFLFSRLSHASMFRVCGNATEAEPVVLIFSRHASRQRHPRTFTHIIVCKRHQSKKKKKMYEQRATSRFACGACKTECASRCWWAFTSAVLTTSPGLPTANTSSMLRMTSPWRLGTSRRRFVVFSLLHIFGSIIYFCS